MISVHRRIMQTKGHDMAKKKIDHRARARKIWPRLVEIARSKRFDTYGENAGSIDLHHRSAAWYLGVIQAECHSLGYPPLQALVVNKRARKPGKGYTATPTNGPAYKKAVNRVWAYDWPKRAPF